MPHFLENHFAFSVPENVPLRSVIGKIQAQDQDAGLSGLMSYSVKDGNKDGLFHVEHRLGKPLDFEKEEIQHLLILYCWRLGVLIL